MSKIIDGIVNDLKAIPGNLKGKSGSVDGKKLLLMNLPYILVGYLCDKIAHLWRVSPGGNVSDKLFHNPLPSFFLKDIVIGAGCGVVL